MQLLLAAREVGRVQARALTPGRVAAVAARRAGALGEAAMQVQRMQVQ